MQNHPYLGPLLANYTPWNEEEAVYVRQLKQFLEYGWNQYDRSNLVAHIVTDAWIINPERTKVLLVVHAASGAWLAPGGHADGNPDVLESAWREAVEETGLARDALTPLLGHGLFDINTGSVPTRQKPHGTEPIHIHFDVCFAFEAREDAPLQISDESLELAWKPVEEALEMMMDCHKRRALKTLQGVLKA